MLKIGPLTIASSCILSPLASVSDLPFRLINRRLGCEVAFTEMVSARALIYENKTTLNKMLATDPADRPLGIQLLGRDPEVIRTALDKARDYEFDIIDFNAACPVTKVTEKGEGASLLKEPKKIGVLLKVVVNNTSAPVTVKIRSGWDAASVNARDSALCAEDAGISALFIHGRTREQGYRGAVDYAVIRAVKESLRIPVIASGDALSPRLIKRLFDETGCDGVAIARGALGNPWIFKEASAFLKDGTLLERPNMDEIADIMIAHFNLIVDFHGEPMGTLIFRKFFSWYCKGIHGIRDLKTRAFGAKSRQQMLEIINKVREMHWDPGMPESAESRIRTGE
jgi:nifR3 family TIM-barrel protein